MGANAPIEGRWRSRETTTQMRNGAFQLEGETAKLTIYRERNGKRRRMFLHEWGGLPEKGLRYEQWVFSNGRLIYFGPKKRSFPVRYGEGEMSALSREMRYLEV